MKKFYSIFLATGKNELTKPNGLIPYTLYKDFRYDTTIATYNNGCDYNDPNIEGVKVDFIDRVTGNSIIDGSIYIMKNAKKIDILHTFFWKRENYLWFFIYKILNKKGKIYVTMDVDERIKKDTIRAKGIKRKIKRIFLKKCDLISAETIELCDYLKENFYDDIKYIPYGVLPSNKDIDYSSKENTIITVGRIGTYQKATEILMEAYKNIYQDIPNWKLKIIGPIEEEFKEEISKFYKENPELSEIVEFTGAIYDRQKLMEEFEKAKIFCLTSRYESFGLVLSEAGSRGDYIISTNIAPARDLTDNEKYGTLFEIDNVEELSKKLKKVCNNEEKIENNCDKIQEFINKNYTWNAVCKKALIYLGEEIEDDI